MIKILITKISIVLLLVILFIEGFRAVSPIVIKKGLNRLLTEEIVDKQFQQSITKKINAIFLGNSRVYRGINPALIKSVTSYNFAHDNDSFVQNYFKLKYVLDNNQNIKYCFVGMDYSTLGVFSDTRNYVYKSKFPPEYMKYYSKKINIKKSINDYYEIFIRLRVSPFLAATKNFVLNKKATVEYEFSKYGQNKDYHVSHSQHEKSTSDFIIYKDNLALLQRMIKLCEDSNTKFVFIHMPNSETETNKRRKNLVDKHFSMIKEFVDNNNVYSIDLRYEFLEDDCYSDFVHLKASCADSLSRLLDSKIAAL